MKPTPQLTMLKDLYTAYHKHVYSAPYMTFPNCFSDSTSTNGMTQLIIWYVRLNGWMAERTGTAGRMVKTKKGMQYIPPTATKGSTDIKCTINQRSVYIEIKNKKTKDKQSDKQKEYQTKIEMSGGIYYIAESLESFIDWFDSNFERNPDYVKFWEYLRKCSRQYKI
jgi:hypothetical protein